MPRSGADTVQGIVRDAFPLAMYRDLWTGNYDKVLPISFQEFDLSTMLPAMFYLFRYGERRGKGDFLKTFAPDGLDVGAWRKAVTIDRIAETLLQDGDAFEGFDGDQNDTEKAILGDLLIGHCLQNRRHEAGRDKQIQRALPAHYLSSWIDLPQVNAHLRNVPEMMVGMLANQQGPWVERSDSDPATGRKKDEGNRFAVGKRHRRNALLAAFNRGIEPADGKGNDRASDRFDENESSVGLDQLLTIRLAQRIGRAPDPSGQTETNRKIPNQRPISRRASEDFSSDIASFLSAYYESLPRDALIGMLESGMAIGLTSVMTGAVDAMLYWEEEGKVPGYEEQKPAELFIDCSIGVDKKIRDAAERSMDHLLRRVAYFPSILMALRLLDHQAMNHQEIKGLDIPTRPYSTKWLDLLGDLLHHRHDQAEDIHRSIKGSSGELLNALRDRSAENEYAEAKSILSDEERKKNQANPILRLARGLTSLMGWQSCHRHLMEMVDSCLFVDRPHGIAIKRKTRRGGTRRDTRSMILSDSALEYLVHLGMLTGDKGSKRTGISFQGFIEGIRKRYGFYIDRTPEGMNISNTILQSNRSELERRLRDLGLLIGVNDAQSMKRLRPRFDAKGRESR